MAASRAPEFAGSTGSLQSQGRPRLSVDTSTQPDGLTRRVVLNMLEAFFRRPILHLLPLVVMVVIGIASAVNSKQEFTSVGTLSVTSESLLADLTDASRSVGMTFESQAAITATQINELLRTDQFMRDVADNAGITPLVEAGTLTFDQLRSLIGASDDGKSIVRVGAISLDPELSYRLAGSTIDAYKDWVVDADVSQSTTTETSLQERVAEKQAAADAADAAVTAKIQEQPAVAIEDRSPVDQQDFARLQDAADRAQSQLLQSQDALDSAKLQADQAAAVVDQRLKVLDDPVMPTAPLGRLKSAAMSGIMFFFLGVVFSVVSVIISSFLDRTVRVPNDITSRYGVDVLAVVPNIAR